MNMDPALWEVVETGSPEDEVSVILRLAPGAEPPPTVRVVSRFDEIVTARVQRDAIVATRQSEGVISLKSTSVVTEPPPLEDAEFGDAIDEEASGPSMPKGALYQGPETGRGVVVGVCDWGLDFTHANFRNADGTTRLHAIWDQRGQNDPLSPAPYNYGRLLTRSAIDAALKDLDPFASLDYNPASADATRTGAHGTHVCDIVAGNRREPGSEVGLATEADIVFVHLAAPQLDEVANLGDSVGMLEGLDFIRQQAAGRPCVLHLSAGKTGGPHCGNTLLERAVDAMLKSSGIVLVQSVGNYAHTSMHAHARVGPDQRHVLDWLTPRNDRTPNELEIWYSGQDVFDVTLIAPNKRKFPVALNSRAQIGDGTSVWGNLYHRLHEPNSGMNHIVFYLYTAAPSGRWRVVLHGREVVDGRLHAWIERDASGRYQSRFPRSQASSRYTTNTICNSFRAIAVGAYDATQPDRPPTRFSSRGPTADGRQKPEVAAPGYRIRAARSMPKGGWKGGEKLSVKSGTSMAAPWVSGTVALMMAAAGRPLTIHEIRAALIGTADPHSGPSGRSSTRLGYGYLNVGAAVDAARALGRVATNVRPLPAARTGEEDSNPTGAPQVWIEDAGEANLEELQMELEAAGVAVEANEAFDEAETVEADDADDAVEVEEADEAVEALEGIEAVEAFDEAEEDAESDATPLDSFDGGIDVPFAWEDVQDALEALGEDVLTEAD